MRPDAAGLQIDHEEIGLQPRCAEPDRRIGDLAQRGFEGRIQDLVAFASQTSGTRIELGPRVMIELTGERTLCILSDRLRAGLKRHAETGPPFLSVVRPGGRPRLAIQRGFGSLPSFVIAAPVVGGTAKHLQLDRNRPLGVALQL